MTDEPDNLVLRYLRGLDTKFDAMREDMREVKTRLSAVAAGLNGVRRDIVTLFEADGRMQVSIDRMGDRLERIEHRLSLRETA